MEDKTDLDSTKPFVSIVLPCYDEEAILENNIETIVSYLKNKNKKLSC